MKPIRFNPNLRLMHCEQWLQAICVQMLKQSNRRRCLSADGYKQFLFCAEVLIANLLLLNNIAADWPLLIRKDKHAKKHGECFGLQHIAIIDACAHFGWIKDNGTSTRFAAGYKKCSTVSLNRFPFGNLTLDNLAIAPRAIHVQLKSAKDAAGNSVALPLEQQEDLLQQMESVNAYLQSLDVEYSPHGYKAKFWLEVIEDFDTAVIRSAADNTVCRIFNETLSQGGRLYGGWWQGINHELRFSVMRIKQQQVAYVDFNAIYLRLAYAYVGCAYPIGDAYLAGPGSRKAWKSLTLSMLQAKSPMTTYPGTILEQASYRAELGSAARAAYAAIEAKHPALQAVWYTGIASRFQCAESDIVLGALLRCQANGLSCLPIHDCLLCPESEATQVARILEATALAVGYHLPIGIETSAVLSACCY